MSSPFFLATASLLCLALGCGSDDAPDSAGSSGQAGNGAGGSTTTGGTKGTSGSSATAGGATAGTNAGGTNAGGTNAGGTNAGGTSAGGTSAHGGSGGGSSKPLSEGCQEYCECHEDNCATTPIPGGKSCGDFCTAMTGDQLDCRLNMCGLVPVQPDNDHCDHSVGIDQCE